MVARVRATRRQSWCHAFGAIRGHPRLRQADLRRYFGGWQWARPDFARGPGLSRPYGAQSPGEPGPGAGPSSGGPDQMSSRPQDRSTRLASPFQLFAVWITSPSWTGIDTRTRPEGERASTFQGRAGSLIAGTLGSCSVQPRQAPGWRVATGTSLTTRVTTSVVPFWIETLMASAALGLGAELAGTGLGLVVPAGAPHPASRVIISARKAFISFRTMNSYRRFRKGLAHPSPSPRSASSYLVKRSFQAGRSPRAGADRPAG